MKPVNILFVVEDKPTIENIIIFCSFLKSRKIKYSISLLFIFGPILDNAIKKKLIKLKIKTFFLKKINKGQSIRNFFSGTKNYNSRFGSIKIFISGILGIYKSITIIYFLYKILNKTKPNLCIVNKDYTEIYELMFFVCKTKRIKTALFPGAFQHSDRKQFYYKNRLNWIIKNKSSSNLFILNFFSFIFPDWLIKFNKDKFFLDNPVSRLFRFILGCCSSHPHCIGFGKQNYNFLDSQEQLNVIQKTFKKNSSNFFLNCKPLLDKIYKIKTHKEKIKKFFFNKYKFYEKKKLILVSLPNYYEHGFLSLEDQLNEIRFIINSLKSLNKNYNIVYSLHPSMNYNFYKKKFNNLTIIKDDITSIIALVDIFISACSTVSHWTSVLKIKTISLNYFDLKFKYLNKKKYVNVVKTKSQFIDNINKLKNKKLFFKNYKHNNVKMIIDGSHCSRLYNSILKI
jgi:hypothetical protein